MRNARQTWRGLAVAAALASWAAGAATNAPTAVEFLRPADGVAAVQDPAKVAVGEDLKVLREAVEVAVPVLTAPDSSAAAKSILLRSSMLGPLLEGRSELQWTTNLPILGMKITDHESRSAYQIKGVEVGLPGGALWLVHEAIDDADRSFMIQWKKTW